MSGKVRLERVGAVAWVTFDNPERQNALTPGMIAEFRSAVCAVEEDGDIRVLILRGGGDRAFVSGADIGQLAAIASGATSSPGAPGDVSDVLAEMSKPVIAALRGWCLGAGVLFALAADIRIAADDVRIGIPAARLGVAYPRTGVARLVAFAGPGVASEMLMSGESLDAQAALRVGLVNKVVSGPAVFDEAQRLATRIAANAPLTVVASKRTVRAVLRPADTDAATNSDAAIRACFASDDLAEGIEAFAEKRPPVFRAR